MKINSFYKNPVIKKHNNCSFKGNPAGQAVSNAFYKVSRVAGSYINAPEQKLIMATTALCLGPLIDLKFAQDDKKVDASIKTASKSIAGGLTGVTIRATFLKIANKYIGYDRRFSNSKSKFINACFFPQKAAELKRTNSYLADIRMKQYCNTIGTLFAILFMVLFSNSKIDVPLTSDIQDLISGVVKGNKNWSKSTIDVVKARIGKMKNWFVRKHNSIISLRKKVSNACKALNGDEKTLSEAKSK